MSAATSLEPRPGRLPARRESFRALPRRQAAWIATQGATATALALSGLWLARPDLAVSLAIALGVMALNPGRWWSFPLVGTAVVTGGLAAGALHLSPIVGAAAIAGALAAWLIPEQTDLMDAVHGGLAGSALAAIGLWLSVQLLPEGLLASWVGAGLSGGIVGLFASQSLVPIALRFDRDRIPGLRAIRKELKPRYRPPVFRALELFRHAARRAPDPEARSGLAEISTWVFRLQVALQSLDRELRTIDVEDVQARIDRYEQAKDADAFTRERRQATASHLRRLLEHRDAIHTERRRTDALVDYAIAFLEEARAGLAIAAELPGEIAPEHLSEVLHRLRSHAAAGSARRASAREVARVGDDA